MCALPRAVLCCKASLYYILQVLYVCTWFRIGVFLPDKVHRKYLARLVQNYISAK